MVHAQQIDILTLWATSSTQLKGLWTWLYSYSHKHRESRSLSSCLLILTSLTPTREVFAWALTQPVSVSLWGMVAYLKLQLAGGSDWGGKSGHIKPFVGPLTWQVTCCLDGRKRCSKKEKDRKRDTSYQTTDVFCTVTQLGGGGVIACRWFDVIWCQEDAQRGWLHQSTLLFSFYSLSPFLTHAHTRSHSLLSSLLRQSYLSYHAATHFLSLFNSLLSFQYSPLSFSSSLLLYLASLSGPWVSAEQWPWARLLSSLPWTDTNRALVTAAGWREGNERGEEMEIRESEREKINWNTRRKELKDGMWREGWESRPAGRRLAVLALKDVSAVPVWTLWHAVSSQQKTHSTAPSWWTWQPQTGLKKVSHISNVLYIFLIGNKFKENSKKNNLLI